MRKQPPAHRCEAMLRSGLHLVAATIRETGSDTSNAKGRPAPASAPRPGSKKLPALSQQEERHRCFARLSASAARGANHATPSPPPRRQKSRRRNFAGWRFPAGVFFSSQARSRRRRGHQDVGVKIIARRKTYQPQESGRPQPNASTRPTHANFFIAPE